MREGVSWIETESHIRKEIDWLRRIIPVFSDKNDPYVLYVKASCSECVLRNIALLITAGKISAREIQRSPYLESFWRISKGASSRISHGKEWHSSTMEQIRDHFVVEGCEVVIEPSLAMGRADLGIYKAGVPDLLVEVGTTSLFKLYINLERMRNAIILLVPDDDRLIEFRII